MIQKIFGYKKLLHLKNESPVLILGVSHRTGSTLLQRLILSTGKYLIWGEQHGQLNPIMESRKALLKWSSGPGAVGREIYQREGTEGFTANMSPSPESIDSAYREFVFKLFMGGDTKVKSGLGWGFKEVRYDARFLSEFSQLYPKVRCIFIVRDIRKVASSLLTWEKDESTEWIRDWTIETLNHWVTCVSSLPENTEHLLVKFEDLIECPEIEISKIERYLKISRNSIDRTTVETKVHGHGAEGKANRQMVKPSEFSNEITEILDSSKTRELLKMLGYD